MALSGQLNDLSLPELIEFFCNQNKCGRLKVFYARGPGLFYFQNGALVDAKIGVLSGVEAVYYAITLENALFKFNPNRPPLRRTIHQPWTQVALEGLRRIDENEPQKVAFPADDPAYLNDPEYLDDDTPAVAEVAVTAKAAAKNSFSPFKMMAEEASAPKRSKKLVYAGIGIAAILGVAALGIPAGWYSSPPPPPAPVKPVPVAAAPDPVPPAPATSQAPDAAANPQNPSEQAAMKRETEREKRRAEEERRRADRGKANSEPAVAPATKPEPPKPTTPKVVTVQVTYDETGRVTGASGGDPAALRIARQKRFPPGKAGSATVTIPVN